MSETPNLDASETGLIQRLAMLEANLTNLKETNDTQHKEVMSGLKDLHEELFRGPESLEGRVRILESLSNKGLAIVGMFGVVIGGLISMALGWVPNPFSRGKP